MLKNRGIKKVIKMFSSCAEEEQWLQRMLKEGWMVKKFDIEDSNNCQYIFEPVKNDMEKNLLIKIDCRQFDRNMDYKKYITALEKAGWIPLAKNRHFSKHIFYSEPTNSHNDIFTRLKTFRKKKKRDMTPSHIPTFVTLVVSLVFIILYTAYENAAFWNVPALTS